MEKKDVYGLTNPQKSIWNMEEFFKGSAINNICGSLTINEIVNFEILKKSINIFIKQNDSFRIRLFIENSTPKQYFCEHQDIDFKLVNINSADEIQKIEKEMVSTPFNTIESPLFEFRLFKLPNGFGGFVINTHHIISDAATFAIIGTSIAKIYSNIKNNQEIDENIPSYKDYISSEQEYIKSDKFKKDEEYWNEKFETIPDVASIPASFRDINNYSSHSKRESFTLPKNTVDQIRNLCSREKVSIFNFFMAIYSLYIGRVSNLDEFVIGTPILNRTNFKEKHTSGMFISTVPLKITIDNNSTFLEFVSNIARDSLSMLRHQKYPYEYLLENLRNKFGNVPNLYDNLISYQITKTVDKSINLPYSVHWIESDEISCGTNIHFHDNNDSGDLTIAYDYLVDKYSAEDINDTHKRILHVIDQLLDNVNIPMKDIEIVTPEEKNKILYEFNNTKVNYPKDKTIVDLFEEQVRKTPDNIAVVFEDQKLTYRELNEKANSLANYLINNGVKCNSVIGLRLNKSLEMIVGILAIIKCGCCYLPINMQYPQDRIEFMLQDSNAKILLGKSETLSDIISDIEKIDIDLSKNYIYENDTSNLEITISPEDLIYIIYTSGSTGKPKGATLCHKNVVRLFKNDKSLFDFNENDSWSMFHSVAFDFSVWEMYGALLFGGKLVLISDNVAQDPELFLQLLRKENVTILNQTPTYFYKLLNCELEKEDSNLNIRYIIFGGESLKPNLIKDWHIKYPHTKLINMYGITETTVHVTYKELTNVDLQLSSSNIGVPIPTLHVIIVDKNLNLLPFGTVGEMCVLGEGVFKGYLNRDDLNNTKLVHIPKYSSKFIYRSGDTAIMHKDGHLEYMGRIDNQIKIRGFRVELGEIEEKILKYSNIKTCIVTKKVDENNRELLCAYYIKNGPLNISALRIQLNNHLPNYMIPQYFIEIEKVPININGKTDIKALPLPNTIHTDLKLTKPRNDIDKVLIKIYNEFLHVKNISISDSFYDLGGDSLTAITISEAINESLNIKVSVKDILKNNIISDLSDYIANLKSESNIYDNIEIAQKQPFYPLSSAQKRIYYTSKMIGENNIVYNIPGAILVNKVLDKEKIKKCFKELIKRHSSFRTSFVLQDNIVQQKILDNVEFDVEVFNESSANIYKIINNFPKPFNLDKAPLLRIALCYLDKNKTLLLLDSHHIIMDGISLEILIKDFCNLYNKNELSDLKVDYKDFSAWEYDSIKLNKFDNSKKYWNEKLKDFEFSALNLPYDFNIPTKPSFKGNTVTKKININDFNKYINCAKKLNVSPYVFFLSVFLVLLYKYTGQEEIIVGSPTSGRNNKQLNDIIGMFVNNLVIGTKINTEQKFSEFAKKIKEQILQDLSHQEYPYDLLVKDLNISTENSQNPLFDVMFTYQNTGNKKLNLDGVSAKIIKSQSNISKFNLSVEIDPESKIVSLEYRTDLFKENTINNMFEHFINALNVIMNNINIPIKDISIISENEKNKVLYTFNNTLVDYPNNKTVIDLFEQQVVKTPNDTAIVFEGIKLTYKELNEKANQLAYCLKEKNLKPEDIVCIFLDKSIEMIIAILAILKNRCTYLPIDITYPTERIEYIIKDSNSKLLLTSRKLDISNFSLDFMYIDLDNTLYFSDNIENINLPKNSNDLAYIMYTSGSTGTPKGVSIENKSIVRLIANNNFIDFKKSDRILQTGSIVFDACTFEIWGALLNGLPLYIIKKEDLLDYNAFSDFILNNKISILWLTAPLFNQLSENNPHMFRTVRCLLTGGDVLSPKHINMVRLANPNLTIINGYGPTENTTFSCCYKIDKTFENSIPIGGPISNSTCYVISKDNNIQPIGIPGELWVGGDGLARGYLNNQKLTSEKFIYSPITNSRIYKTGDLVKWNSEGYLEFLGRIDSQIKIRGFRVELSEITSVILSNKDIKEAITIFDTVHNNKSICSYIVSDKKINIDDLKKYLELQLPKYMIPTYFMQLDNLPINQNGKVNKKLLPKDFSNYNNDSKLVLPSTDTEKTLYKIFSKILDISDFSITDNFFNLGGDSITAMKLQIEILKNNLNVTYSDIFKYTSVYDLAKFIEFSNSKDIITHSDNNLILDYDKLLSTNKIENIELSTANETPIGDILITGVTGFLGSHILDSFIKNETGIAYCLIRPKNNISSLERLKSTLHFYFDNKYDNLIGKRIICINGDITEENLGLSVQDYLSLGNKTSTVIHSAALVKHFGNYEDFEKINVGGTKLLIDFCKKFNCKLMHISTISVSGNNFAEGSFIENNITEDIHYNETKFYIGQNLDNLYVKSKFLAEKLVFDAIKDGLKAYVLRMGNLTSRYSEGKFQQNHFENAFVNRIKSLLQIGSVPEYMQEGYVEFTPIDCCADAIINISNHYNRNFNVFHVFNDNHVPLIKLYNILQKLGINVNIVTTEKFNSIIDELLKRDSGNEILSGIIRDFNSEKKLIYQSNIKIHSEFTKQFLKSNGFEWPFIDINYIKKYLKYLIDIGYLNIKLKED